MRKILIACLLLAFSVSVRAQGTRVWNGKTCAVALTYDDAITEQLDNAVPLLDSLGLKASFYLSGYFPGFVSNIDRWRALAKTGHELGNHTLFHPCTGNTPGREWVSPTYDLSTYTVKRMTDEMRMTNILLKTLDGKTDRTFAFPCGDTKIGGVAYYDQVKGDFVAARGTTGELTKLTTMNTADVGSYAISGQSGKQLIDLVKQAERTGSLIVFLFHGVGGGHSLNVDLPAHRELLQYLKANEATVWTAPFIDLVQYAAKQTTNPKNAVK